MIAKVSFIMTNAQIFKSHLNWLLDFNIKVLIYYRLLLLLAKEYGGAFNYIIKMLNLVINLYKCLRKVVIKIVIYKSCIFETKVS